MISKNLGFVLICALIIIVGFLKNSPPIQTIENFASKPLLVDGIYAIKGGREGKWCADEGWKVVCNRNHIGPWERFKLVNLGNNNIMLSGGRSGHKEVCRIKYVWWNGSYKFMMQCGAGGRRPHLGQRLKRYGGGMRMAWWDEVMKVENAKGYWSGSKWKNVIPRYRGGFLSDDQEWQWAGRWWNLQKFNNANRPYRGPWERFEFVLIEARGEKGLFCPDPAFLEHNPTACLNPYSKWDCERTPKVGWKPSIGQCKTKFKKAMMKNAYDNIDFFKLIHKAHTVSQNNMKKLKKERNNNIEVPDPKNNFQYKCDTGSTYAIYDHNTLTKSQLEKVKRRWPGKPPSYYACKQGCSWDGKCKPMGPQKLMVDNVPSKPSNINTERTAQVLSTGRGGSNWSASRFSKLVCKPGAKLGASSGAYSTSSDCEARDRCLVEMNENCDVRVKLRDRCTSARNRYSWSNFGSDVSRNGCRARVEKVNYLPPPPKLKTGSGLGKKCWIKMPTGCDRNLGQTSYDNSRNPKKPVDWTEEYNKSNSIKWGWDGTDEHCLSKRREDWNRHCNRKDAEAKISYGNPSALRLAPKNDGEYGYYSRLSNASTRTKSSKTMNGISGRSVLDSLNSWTRWMYDIMGEIYKLCLMMEKNLDEGANYKIPAHIDVKKLDWEEWNDKVSHNFKTCKDKKSGMNKYLCKQFKQHLAILIDVSRKIVYMNNETTSKCRNTKEYGKLVGKAPC